jgi:hypothetical protein
MLASGESELKLHLDSVFYELMNGSLTWILDDVALLMD